LRIQNNVQPSFNYNFGFPATQSYTSAPPIFHQPTFQPYHFGMAQAQQTLFQGWAGFGGASFGGASFGGASFGGASFGAGGAFGGSFGGGFSASAGFSGAGAFPSFGTNSTDLSSVFGSLEAIPSFGLAGGNDPFAANLQSIEAQMFALAGQPGRRSSNPFDNPFTAGLQRTQQQLVNLTFNQQPFFF
jgi:hypothetical protein